MNTHVKKVRVRVAGMTCQACELTIERKWRKISGIQSVSADHASGSALLCCTRIPSPAELQSALGGGKYSVQIGKKQCDISIEHPANTRRDYVELGAILLIITGLYFILRSFKIFPEIGVSEGMGYGVVFLIGLVAAFSTCIAVSGGLLLATAAEFAKRHPEATSREKMKPHIAFNIGRVLSYTLFGGLIGLFGSVFTLSPIATGYLIVVTSIVMVLLGVRLLNIFPWLTRFQIRMPKWIGHRIHDVGSKKHSASAAFFLGASTFFLPCGFTQALQLYVLSRGDAAVGALTMLVFAVGTLPALLSVGAVSSFVRGRPLRLFTKFAGVLVVLIGVTTIQNGMVLAGLANGGGKAKNAPVARIENGKQIVEMKIVGYAYTPSRFTVQMGVPVEWRIDGSQAAGCAKVVTIPKLNVTGYAANADSRITFTPTQVGSFPFSCTMGMTTPGAQFDVVASSVGSVNVKDSSDTAPLSLKGAQRLSLVVNDTDGFSPNEFTVKKGVPVELEIDAQIPLSGCMGTIVIPEYNVAQSMPKGKSIVRFTPTSVGSVVASCSMGIPLVQFNVVES